MLTIVLILAVCMVSAFAETEQPNEAMLKACLTENQLSEEKAKALFNKDIGPLGEVDAESLSREEMCFLDCYMKGTGLFKNDKVDTAILQVIALKDKTEQERDRIINCASKMNSFEHCEMVTKLLECFKYFGI